MKRLFKRKWLRECQRIDAFELWCWRRLLRVPWTTTRSNQSILKAISPEYLLEGLMLKLQYFGHLMWRSDSLEKALMLGETEGRRRRGWEDEMVGWHHRLDGQEFAHAPGVGDEQGSLTCCSPWGCKKSDRTEQLNWPKLNRNGKMNFSQRFNFSSSLVSEILFKIHTYVSNQFFSSRVSLDL